VRRRLPLLALAFCTIAASPARADTADCQRESDDSKRLACYDAVFGRPPTASEAATTEPPGGGAQPEPSQHGQEAQTGQGAGQHAMLAAVASTAWELTPDTKRGTFVVRTYLPNFVLPAHWSTSINHAPSTPTRGVAVSPLQYKPVEAKIQISLRTKVVEGLLLPDADLWFAYTQRSLWQVWDTQESAPFRSTDYQPEAIYVIPTPKSLASLPAGWTWRMSQIGLMHQSNGQSGALSRSWNRVYAGASLDHGDFGLNARVYQRLHDGGGDDNPDITRYIGNTELAAAWLPGLATAQLTWRTHLGSFSRGSAQLDWSYPVNRKRPQGLRWYVQLFTGYGETLLDYNHRQTSVGLGLTLFQF
jgi:phospholipase A1